MQTCRVLSTVRPSDQTHDIGWQDPHVAVDHIQQGKCRTQKQRRASLLRSWPSSFGSPTWARTRDDAHWQRRKRNARVPRRGKYRQKAQSSCRLIVLAIPPHFKKSSPVRVAAAAGVLPMRIRSSSWSLFRISGVFSSSTTSGSLKSEVQHPPSGKVHSCKSVRHTASFNLRSA